MCSRLMSSGSGASVTKCLCDSEWLATRTTFLPLASMAFLTAWPKAIACSFITSLE